MHDGLEHEQQQKYAVVKREDAEGAAHIKSPGAMGVIAGVEKNSGNQKSGENKKDIDPRPSPGELVVVLREDHEKSDRAQAVKRGKERAIFRLSGFRIPGDWQLIGQEQTLNSRLYLGIPDGIFASILS